MINFAAFVHQPDKVGTVYEGPWVAPRVAKEELLAAYAGWEPAVQTWVKVLIVFVFDLVYITQSQIFFSRSRIPRGGRYTLSSPWTRMFPMVWPSSAMRYVDCGHSYGYYLISAIDRHTRWFHIKALVLGKASRFVQSSSVTDLRICS